jgi:hypothetical protein
MFLIGTVAFIIGSVANVLNGGQLLLPTLLMTAGSRRLKSSREANKAAHDAFMTMLRAETAGLPEEERQRVSVLLYESRSIASCFRHTYNNMLHLFLLQSLFEY